MSTECTLGGTFGAHAERWLSRELLDSLREQAMLNLMTDDEPVFETIGDPGAATSLVFTCEHASNVLPEWTAEPADAKVLDAHWGFDIGAADLTRHLVSQIGGVAVLSRFSRLVCDPNREPHEQSFVVERIGDHALSFNRDVDIFERARRRDRYYTPYHGEIDRLITGRLARGLDTRLVSIHSFTPQHENGPREMEVGVLFDAHENLAECLQAQLSSAGFKTAANEPYSGYSGLIHAARRHGRANGIAYVELEIRQDLISTARDAGHVAARIAPAITRFMAD